MAMFTLELPVHEKQRAFNLRRLAELLADPELARIEGRIETDRYGHVVLSPLSAPSHGAFQAETAYLLRNLMPKGRVVTECPISTADGVKAADVAWASLECLTELGEKVCFPAAPEICVEVLSPSNTGAEIQEKAKLYFDAGAEEVWLCAPEGRMRFLGPTAMHCSRLCPEFPKQIQLR